MTDKIEKRKQPLPCRTMARQQRLCGRRGDAAYRVCSFRRGVHRRTQQHLEYTLSLQCEGIIDIEKKSKKITKVRIKMNINMTDKMKKSIFILEAVVLMTSCSTKNQTEYTKYIR